MLSWKTIFLSFSCRKMRLVLDIKYCLEHRRKLSYGYHSTAAKLLHSCPTLCDPIDGGPPGSPVPGILQARTLEWVAISFSNAWKWKVKVKSLSHVRLFATPWSAAYQAPLSMGFSKQEYGVGCHCLLQSTKRRHFWPLHAWYVGMIAGAWATIIRPWGQAVDWWRSKMKGGRWWTVTRF